MAGSPYATLLAILQADLATARQAFFDHASRHQCGDGCETKRELRAVRDSLRDRVACEMASPSPPRTVTFMPLPPGLRSELSRPGSELSAVTETGQ